MTIAPIQSSSLQPLARDAINGIIPFQLEYLPNITIYINTNINCVTLSSIEIPILDQIILPVHEFCLFWLVLETFPAVCPYETVVHILQAFYRGHTFSDLAYMRKIFRSILPPASQAERKPIFRALASLNKRLMPWGMAVTAIRNEGCQLTILPGRHLVIRR